jgi:hypothetical protein
MLKAMFAVNFLQEAGEPKCLSHTRMMNARVKCI